ncbi:MAG: hypothetical protein EBZ78_09775 [Verrucomicrobia bacterium]|nr:hypothetical protein [Verrucomicrobiota bacterium]
MLAYDATNGFFDDDGTPLVELRLRMSQSEADALLASFDPGSASSPPAAECRASAAVAEAIAALGAP